MSSELNEPAIMNLLFLSKAIVFGDTVGLQNENSGFQTVILNLPYPAETTCKGPGAK